MGSNFQIHVRAEFGSDLSGRHAARQLRDFIVEAAGLGYEHVAINFDGVDSMSADFADEAFASLVKERGQTWFAERVEMACLSQAVAIAIAEAVADRCGTI
jgi:hypothetical protein